MPGDERRANAAELSAEIKGKLRQFNRVLMSYIDFQQAGGIAQETLKRGLHDNYPHDRFLLQGLNCGMIIAYCRPFSHNVGRNTEGAVPDLPGRFMRLLSNDEKEVHDVVIKDRHSVLAHSDWDAWEMEPVIHRLAGSDLLVPMHNDVHAPLTREATEQLLGMCDKLREACSEERRRLEPELKPHLSVVELDPKELKRTAAKLGVDLPL